MDTLFNIDFGDNFKTAVEHTIINLFNNENNINTILNDSNIKIAKDEIKDLVIKSNCDTQKCAEVLKSKSYEEEKINFFVSILKERQDEILFLTLVHFNSSYGETVTKLNWCLKLIYGTSDHTKLKYPALQLTLDTVSDGEYRQVGYDINKQMLGKIINQLENIDKV